MGAPSSGLFANPLLARQRHEALTQEVAMDPNRLAVIDFLDKNQKTFQGMSVDFIAMNVRVFLPHVAGQFQPSELRAIVAVWRSLHGPIFLSTDDVLPPSTHLPASPDGKLKEAVQKVIAVVTDGVPIISHKDGNVNIGVGGLTAELNKGDAKASVGVSWGGTLSVETEKGDFHFSGELSTTRWQIQLSYPEDTAVPDLTMVGDVIGAGHKAMGNIISATTSFKNLNDISGIKAAIAPNIQPVKDAVEAVQGIAKAPIRKVDFGISIGSPDPAPGQTGMPQGAEVKATLTIRF
jgi:hypothetical protein